MRQAGTARWIADGRADPGLVAVEIALGPQFRVPSGYWGVEVITECGHRMARSGFTAGDVVADSARRGWTECDECGRELVFHVGVFGSVTFMEAA